MKAGHPTLSQDLIWDPKHSRWELELPACPHANHEKVIFFFFFMLITCDLTVISDEEPKSGTANPTPELELVPPCSSVLTSSSSPHPAESAESSPNFRSKASPVAVRAERHPPVRGGQGAERGGRARPGRIETGRAAWS